MNRVAYKPIILAQFWTTEDQFCPFLAQVFVLPLRPEPCGGGLTVRASYHNLQYRLALRSHAGVSVSLPQHVSQDLLSKRYKHLFTMEPASPRGPLNRNGRGRCCLILGLSKYMMCACVWMCVWVSAVACVCLWKSRGLSLDVELQPTPANIYGKKSWAKSAAPPAGQDNPERACL